MNSTTISFRLLASNALSLLGNSVAGVALPLILLATTGDPLAAGTLALVCALPQVMAGVLGGVLLDRFNRRDVSIVSDCISAAAVAALPIIDLTVGLSFGWFVLFGLLGAIGDIPGMTARDTLLPAAVAHDKRDLQQFMGLTQSVDSLVTIIGPAVAAFLMGIIGTSPCLWVTAGFSLLAAFVTTTIPRAVGGVLQPEQASCEKHAQPGDASFEDISVVGIAITSKGTRTVDLGALVKSTFVSAREGARILLRSDAILSLATLLSLGIVMILGSFQGLVLPVFFIQEGAPELLGYTLSALSAGLLVGSLVYAALVQKLSQRTWYVASMVGMAAGIIVMGLLPSYPVLLAGAFALGLMAGPASALLGFFMLDRIPEERRGSALGTQNSLMLVAAPLALFATSALVSGVGLKEAAIILVFGWLALTAFALTAKGMRKLSSNVD